jgi:GT2 family glycosyltransferase/SAM-dependent methyltransferase
MDSNRLSKAYNEFYYTHNCGDQPYQRNEGWLNFFGSVADRIVRDIGPSTVLDAGCAMGFLVETLRARAVDAVGVDISEYAIEKAHADVRPFCWVGAVTDPFPRKYDLIVCIEVLEHLSPQEADRAIENFCTHADDILFSSTPFDYKEATHINVRPPDYWAQRFAQHEFYRDIDFDASFLTPWAVRFRKTCDPAWRIVYSYERQLWQLEKEIQARRQLTVEQMNQLSEAQQQVGALTGKASENEETIKSLTAEITRQQETIESLAGLANKEQSQQGLAQNNDKSQPVPDQLPAQLSEQYEKIESIISAIVLQQSAIEGLISQASEKEKTIERLRAELSDKQQSEQKLGLQIAEARTTIETLLAQKQENEQAVRALSMEMAHREHAVRASKAREKGTAFTLNALSQRLAEREKAIEWLSSQLADKEALIAYQEAKLADVNSSMVWWLYNRIKYPYLLFLFRLYERIKYPYLIRLYRRLGLAASPPASPQPTQAAANASLLPANTFPVIEVTATPALLPHRASVDIIICVHNALEDVKRCLDSVVCHTRMPYSLILVDDGSNDETRAYLVSFADSQSALLIRNEQAKGYTFAANQGLKRSRSEYVVLLNSDTVVTPLWLDRMVACGESNAQVGLVGPLSNVASWQSIPEIICDGDWAENRLPAGFSVADMGKLVGQYSARLYPRIPFLNGFCLMIKRGVLEQIGYFDEAVFGKGYGEENDFCLRARKAGWQLAIADDTYIYHAQSRSYSHERRKELSKQADVALATKHEPQMIIDGVKKCRFDRVLEGVRARNRAMVERKQLLEAGMKLWEGKRVHSFYLSQMRAAAGMSFLTKLRPCVRWEWMHI